MDYEQKYKDALEKLQEAFYSPETPHVAKAWLLTMFPALAESEDEKIRKELIGIYSVGAKVNAKTGDILDRDIVAWLEKQGEHKPYGQRKECNDCQFNYAGERKGFCQMKRDEQKHADNVEPKFKVGDIVQYITDSTDRRKIEEIDTLCNMYHTDSSPIMFEIEDEWKVVVNAEDVEQESVDKVEPKFKVGDWVVLPLGIVAHIDSLNSTDYQVTTTDGKICDFKISKQENYRLWSIQDAKDGDVLASKDGNEILIFRNLDTSTSFSSYYNIAGKGESGWAVYFIPATKEQRDTLIKAMANDGYTFDFEKKELKKMEVVSKESKDEQIRKAIKSGIRHLETQLGYDAVDGVDILDIYSWLEKQGEKTNPYSGISFEYNGHIWGMCARDNGVDILLDKHLFKHLEKQGGQTHAALSQSSNQGLYTAESVFKVGEWIITTCGVVYQIKDIQGPNVTLIKLNGDESIFDISFLDNAQLWTITDAEDGDVLSGEIDGEVFVFLFNQIQDRWIVAHAYYSETDGEFIEKAYLHRYHLFSPATKEQHSLLFQKMKEAGYEWNSEKKELKKAGSKTFNG